MDIIGIAFIVLGSSMLFPIAAAGLLRLAYTHRTSKRVNVPVCTPEPVLVHAEYHLATVVMKPQIEVRYQIPISEKQLNQFKFCQYLIRQGILTDDLPEEQAVAD